MDDLSLVTMKKQFKSKLDEKLCYSGGNREQGSEQSSFLIFNLTENMTLNLGYYVSIFSSGKWR